MKITRVGAFSLAVLVGSTLAGGVFGNRVLAGRHAASPTTSASTRRS